MTIEESKEKTFVGVYTFILLWKKGIKVWNMVLWEHNKQRSVGNLSDTKYTSTGASSHLENIHRFLFSHIYWHFEMWII